MHTSTSSPRHPVIGPLALVVLWSAAGTLSHQNAMFGEPPLPLRRPIGVHSSSLAAAGVETSCDELKTSYNVEMQDRQLFFVDLYKKGKPDNIKGRPS